MGIFDAITGAISGAVAGVGTAVLDVVAGGIAWAIGLLANLILLLSAALPDGDIWELPTLAAQWETGLGWLNWLVPVGQIAALMGVWVAATVAYYAFQFILRHAIFKNG